MGPHKDTHTHVLLHHTFICSLQGLKPSLAQRVIFPATAYQRHPRRRTCIEEKKEEGKNTQEAAAKKSFLRWLDVKCASLAATLMTLSATQQLKLTARDLVAHLNTYPESKHSFSQGIRTKSLTLNQSNCCNYDVLIQAESRRDTPAN